MECRPKTKFNTKKKLFERIQTTHFAPSVITRHQNNHPSFSSKAPYKYERSCHSIQNYVAPSIKCNKNVNATTAFSWYLGLHKLIAEMLFKCLGYEINITKAKDDVFSDSVYTKFCSSAKWNQSV